MLYILPLLQETAAEVTFGLLYDRQFNWQIHERTGD